MKDKLSLSIVIPIYNEKNNVTILLKEIKKVLTKNIFLEDYEIILIDDCSDDETISIISKIDDQKIVKLFNSTNRGQSYSINNGIMQSKFNTVLTLDGDLQNNPKDIPLLIEKYINNAEIKLIGGIRKKRKDSTLKIVSSIIANHIRSKILDDDCSDTGCALKIFDKKIFLKFPYFNGIHRFLPALFKGYGHKTFFIIVDHRPRKFGKSNYGTFLRLFAGIRDIIKVALIIKKNKRNRV